MLSLTCEECSKGGTEQSLRRCVRCKSVRYCSVECQRANWKKHRPDCVLTEDRPATEDGSIKGVVIPCDGDPNRSVFRPVQVPSTHDIFLHGVVSPMSVAVGVPITIGRRLRQDPLTIPSTQAFDNQIVTYLMINPVTGLAPPEWQMGIGTVTVVRQDRRPLTAEAIETIWMFCDSLLDEFSEIEDGGSNPHSRMNPQAFETFCEEYKEHCVMNGRTAFVDMSVPI